LGADADDDAIDGGLDDVAGSPFTSGAELFAHPIETRESAIRTCVRKESVFIAP
jgi:hypothetical protein